MHATALAGVWQTLADPWSNDFMVSALIEMTLLGVLGAALGTWIVLFGLSYSTESLAHALFPGLVLAALGGFSLLLGGAAGALVAALAIALVARAPGVERDTAVAVVTTALFGLGTLLALSPATPAGLAGLLFGDVLGLSPDDVLATAVLTALTLVALWLLHARLLATGFDRDGARALGVRPLVVELALLALIAVAVLVAVQALGNLLVVAVLVAPAAAARLLANRVVTIMALASALALVASVIALYASFYAAIAGGAAIAVAMVALYGVVAIGGALSRRS